MKLIERLWLVADLARKVVERDGASARPCVIEWASARSTLTKELDELERLRKGRARGRRPRR